MPAALKMRMNILLFMANVEIKITTSLRVRSIEGKIWEKSDFFDEECISEIFNKCYEDYDDNYDFTEDCEYKKFRMLLNTYFPSVKKKKNL